VIKGPAGRILLETDCGGCIGLGIAIHQQCGLICRGKACSEIHCRGGFAYSAFLVGNGDDASQIILPNVRNVSNSHLRCKMFHVEHFTRLRISVNCQSVSRGTPNSWGFSTNSADPMSLVLPANPIFSLRCSFRPEECSTWNIRSEINHSKCFRRDLHG
jgi:hypothetical protein